LTGIDNDDVAFVDSDVNDLSDEKEDAIDGNKTMATTNEAKTANVDFADVDGDASESKHYLTVHCGSRQFGRQICM
jgi:RNA-splicing ligase RtcB